MKQIITTLRDNHLKVTPQRISILNMLFNSTAHPSAETIYSELHSKSNNMSLATIYKTLKTYKNHNIIREMNVGEDSFRYDGNTEDHSHAICLDCKTVIDLPILESASLLRSEVSTLADFNATSEQLYFYGVCNKCSNA